MTTSTEQIERLLALVPYLQRKGEVSVAEAAARFGVSERVIERDLNVLMMCGLPGQLPGEIIDFDFEALEDDRVIRIRDADFLARMRDGALLVNMARGPVVDTPALLAELHAGRLTAAVDVVDTEPLPADSPWWDAPGLLVSPHVGGQSSAMWPRAHRLVREQLTRYAAGEPLHNVMTGAY